MGEIYVPSKYSQNIFTSVSWDVCSVMEGGRLAKSTKKKIAAVGAYSMFCHPLGDCNTESHSNSYCPWCWILEKRVVKQVVCMG